MKGAYETFLVLLIGMTFTLLGFSMVEITFKYNNARLFQESIVSLVERHNRYDNDIDTLIKEAKQNCRNCSYKVVKKDSRYLVTVNFDVNVSVLKYKKIAEIKSMTQSIT